MNVAISTVPGPRVRGSICGAAVTEIYSVGILSAASAFNLTAWSYADTVNLAVLSDDRTFFGLFQINEVFSQTDVAYARFIIIGIGIMLLMIFRPQGIIGDRREVLLDAR